MCTHKKHHAVRLDGRVLEPEVMDGTDEARDYDSMDHTGVNRSFVDDLLLPTAVFEKNQACRVLDLGTGTAQIPIELCRRNNMVRVTGVDLADNMLELGRENVARAGLDTRISLQPYDAKQLPWAENHFTVVMSNSIVHHIAEPALVLKEALRVVQSGGLLFFRDLLRPRDQTLLNHLVEIYTADDSSHQREMFENSLRAALSLSEIRVLVEQLGYDPQTVHTSSDRHWTMILMAK